MISFKIKLTFFDFDLKMKSSSIFLFKLMTSKLLMFNMFLLKFKRRRYRLMICDSTLHLKLMNKIDVISFIWLMRSTRFCVWVKSCANHFDLNMFIQLIVVKIKSVFIIFVILIMNWWLSLVLNWNFFIISLKMFLKINESIKTTFFFNILHMYYKDY